ncbi:unnamed protein product [Polarella glacialis]|uniref:Uncharacterized protein n=1 Tax=Polarella glacialis TaxID=89957 RepID=A0A813GEB4_POLGL|nr:unnamed protein product [Polarella glacialis]
MLDELVESLVASKNSSLPNLKKISISGFSAGCQFVSRWSFFSMAPLKAKSNGIPVGIIIGDCSSYMYLNKHRPAASCVPWENTGPNHTCQHFQEPAAAQQEQCPQFDDFKYGFSRMPKKGSYLKSFRESEAVQAEVIDKFRLKGLRFLIGQNDACNCQFGKPSDYETLGAVCVRQGQCCDSFPAPNCRIMAARCPAMLEGSNRLQRGLNYASYLRDFYARKGQFWSPPVATFTGVLTHSFGEMASSPTFSSWVWGV